MVMRHHPALVPAMLLLVVMAPPVLVNVWLRLQHPRSSLAGHREILDRWSRRPHRSPSVDVFLPSCGEPLAVLRNTFRHAAGLRWAGRLTVYVLDDADLPAVRA